MSFELWFSQDVCPVMELLGCMIDLPLHGSPLSGQKGLHNSMKLRVLLCRAIQDRWVIVESSHKTWSTGGKEGKSLNILA